MDIKELLLPKSHSGVEIKNTSTLTDKYFLEKVSQLYVGCIEFSKKKNPNKYGPEGLYPHQRQAILALCYSLVNGHFGGKTTELAFTFSRRGGKTESELLLIDFLLVFGPTIFEQPTFEISLTVNKQEQATFYSELFALVQKTEDFNLNTKDVFGKKIKVKVKGNSKKKEIEMNTGGILRILSLKGKNHTGFNTDWLIIGECQDVPKDLGEYLERQLKPTLALKNGTMSYSGVANDHQTYFKEKLDDKNIYVLKRNVVDILKLLETYLKKKEYRTYRNNYSFVKDLYERYKKGELSYKEKRVFETEFLLKWLKEGKDSFISMATIDEISLDYDKVNPGELEGEVKVGIDFGKSNDSTVVTITEKFEDGYYRVVDFLTFTSKGMEYTSQVKLILEFLVPYLRTELVNQILGDNTGVGNAVLDIFEYEYSKLVDVGILKPIHLSRINFNAKTKDDIGNTLLLTLLSKLIIFPKENKFYELLYKQFETLEKTTRNGKLTYSHKNEDDKDDFPDSIGLSLLGFLEEYNQGFYGESVF